MRRYTSGWKVTNQSEGLARCPQSHIESGHREGWDFNRKQKLLRTARKRVQRCQPWSVFLFCITLRKTRVFNTFFFSLETWCFILTFSPALVACCLRGLRQSPETQPKLPAQSSDIIQFNFPSRSNDYARMCQCVSVRDFKVTSRAHFPAVPAENIVPKREYLIDDHTDPACTCCNLCRVSCISSKYPCFPF